MYYLVSIFWDSVEFDCIIVYLSYRVYNYSLLDLIVCVLPLTSASDDNDDGDDEDHDGHNMIMLYSKC